MKANFLKALLLEALKEKKLFPDKTTPLFKKQFIL
jgi:hypothetical protein